jgi:UDP:flavonoid glycosyltransferase YjiC (YdhE family)
MRRGGGRFLLVTWDGGGNVSPLVALGVLLGRRGHDVTVLGPAALAPRVTAEGLGFTAHRDARDWLDGTRFEWPPGPTREQQRALLRGLAADVGAVLDRSPVDVAVIDYMQPAALSAAERAGLPHVAFVHTLYSRVARGPMSPMVAMCGGPEPVNELRTELGLPTAEPVDTMLDRANLTLVGTTIDLDRPDVPQPSHVRFVGPLVEDAGPDAGWRPPWSSGRPAAHACTSTVATTEHAVDLLQRVIDACAPLDVSTFVTATDPVRRELRPAANTFLAGYVRHRAVLPHVDLVVCHGGLSTIGAALACGVPLVCVAQQYEQPDNAAHVAELGVGLALPRDASDAAIRDAVERALPDDKITARAREVSASLAPTEPHPAVAALEELLA